MQNDIGWYKINTMIQNILHDPFFTLHVGTYKVKKGDRVEYFVSLCLFCINLYQFASLYIWLYVLYASV